MNQNTGRMEKILVIGDDSPDMTKEFSDALAKHKGYKLQSVFKKTVLGNPERKGPALTAADSDTSEKVPKAWPTLELYERIPIKGIWFMVTRMKIGSGSIGLKMLTTEQVIAEKLTEAAK